MYQFRLESKTNFFPQTRFLRFCSLNAANLDHQIIQIILYAL